MLSTKLRVNWPFGSGEAQNIDFQDSCHVGHLEFPTGRILASFSLKVTLMLPTVSSFKPVSLSVQKRKRKIEIQDDHHGRHLGYLSEKI